MKKPFRWILSIIVAVLIMTWAIYDEISIAHIQSALRYIVAGEDTLAMIALILTLIALIIVIRILIALIAYFPRAVEKQRELNQARANTSSVSGDAELDFLNSLLVEEGKGEPPARTRPTSCSGCGAAISASDMRCAYCNTSVS